MVTEERSSGKYGKLILKPQGLGGVRIEFDDYVGRDTLHYRGILEAKGEGEYELDARSKNFEGAAKQEERRLNAEEAEAAKAELQLVAEQYTQEHPEIMVKVWQDQIVDVERRVNETLRSQGQKMSRESNLGGLQKERAALLNSRAKKPVAKKIEDEEVTL